MTSPQPQVAVRSTVHREVAPDWYAATVRMVSRGPDAATATASLTAGFERIERTIDALPGDDLRVERSAASHRRVAAEWQASREATITGRDCERASDVLGALAALGAQVYGLELDGPAWYLDEDNPAHGEAQVDAVREAHARARRYAEALGGSLGRLIEVADTEQADTRGVDTTEFTPRPVPVRVTINARWALVLP
jgi:uncharacterized protein YggE